MTDPPPGSDTAYPLPEGLPRPEDDGACDHLPSARLPDVALPSTRGGRVRLADLRGTAVLYLYPATGRPGEPLPTGWNEIPGARGCTPQSCAFRDHRAELDALRASVYGISTQPTDEQREAAERLHLPFPLLSDAGLVLQRALGLPVFEADGRTFLKRVTLIADDGVIARVFYPVFPPDANAGEVVAWLAERRGRPPR